MTTAAIEASAGRPRGAANPRSVGRPKSDHRFCKVCGEPLVLGENARETKKGSGRPRAKCKKCENAGRYKRRNPKPAILVFDIPENSEIHAARAAANLPRIDRITLKISCSWRPRHARAIWFERLNPVGMVVQKSCNFTTVEDWKEGLSREKSYPYYEDSICDECGGRIRYDSHFERVCVVCGLVHGEHIAVTDSDMRGWSGVKQTEWRSKHGPRLWWGRDAEHDRRDDDGEGGPRIYDKYYAKTRAGAVVDVARLKLDRLLATGQPLRKPPRRRR